MRNLIVSAICCFFCIVSYTQKSIDVTDQTIKIGARKEEELLFSFAEGDKIIFSYQETSNKDLKEIEVVEYPSITKFSDYKKASIEKTFTVNRQGIYVFRFKNSAISGRVCKIKIQRVPASAETNNYNTSVKWIDKQDTSWVSFTKDVVVGYDTSYVQKKRKDLVKVDTLFVALFDKQVRVHSETAIGKDQNTTLIVNLPKNMYSPNLYNVYESTELVAWTYWIGVGQKSMQEYNKANENLISQVSTIGSLMGYGALAKLAVTGISLFTNSQVGDNVRYQFITYLNNQQITFDNGNIVSASGRNDQVKQGSFIINLYNDNFRDGIDVNVKMIAMQIHKVWKDVVYAEQSIKERTEKQIFKEPVINTQKVPVSLN